MAGLNILCLIVDCNPCWWGKILEEEGADAQCSLLMGMLDSIGAFCSTHCLRHPLNKLLVVAANGLKYQDIRVLFSGDDYDGGNIQAAIRNRLLETVSGGEAEQAKPQCSLETRLAGALTTALCYTNRLKKQSMNSGSMQITSRILVVKLGDDITSQHLNLMNIFFAAQKQASDITGGIYIHVKLKASLLQYLLTVFLPSPEERLKVSVPSVGDVDYRPACFCHQKLISTGWVCSVCLSVFCQFTPICSTCQTAFKFLPAVPKTKKHKKGKDSDKKDVSYIIT